MFAKVPQLRLLGDCRAWVEDSLWPVLADPRLVRPEPKLEDGSSPFASRDPVICRAAVLCWLACPRVCAAAELTAPNDRAAAAAATMTVLNFICPLPASAGRQASRARATAIDTKHLHNTINQDEKITFLRRLTVAGICGDSGPFCTICPATGASGKRRPRGRSLVRVQRLDLGDQLAHERRGGLVVRTALLPHAVHVGAGDGVEHADELRDARGLGQRDLLGDREGRVTADGGLRHPEGADLEGPAAGIGVGGVGLGEGPAGGVLGARRSEERGRRAGGGELDDC